MEWMAGNKRNVRSGRTQSCSRIPKGGWKLKATRMENVRGNGMREE